MSNGKKDDLTKSDLTRVEDLEEYVHEEDPEVDSLFSEEAESDEVTSPQDDNFLDDLDEESSELLENISQDSDEPKEIEDEESQSHQEDILNELRSELSGLTNIDSLNVEAPEDSEEQDDDQETNDNEEIIENDNTTFEDETQLDTEANDLNNENFNEDLEDNDLALQEDEQQSLQEDFFDDFDEDTNENLSLNELVESDYENEDYNEHDSIENDDFREDHNDEEQASPPPLPPAINKIPPIKENHLAPEDFEEVRSFANQLTYGQVRIGGNPSFSIKLSGVYKNCHEKLKNILAEHKLIDDERSLDLALDLGEVLIAQISEYSAIFLASKLKNLSKEIYIDLSDQIHKSDSYELDNKGLTNRNSIFQNKELKYDRKERKFNVNDIKIFTSDNIAKKEIIENIGFIHEEMKFNDSEYLDYDEQKEQLKNNLIEKVKVKALNMGANAVISTVFQLYESDENESIFLSIQGDAVVLEDI